MSPYVHASGPQGYCTWKRGDIFIQQINNSGANKDCGLITHIKSSAEKASGEGDMTDSASLPSLDMILPKIHASLDFTSM